MPAGETARPGAADRADHERAAGDRQRRRPTGSAHVRRSLRNATENTRMSTGARYSSRIAVATFVSEIVLKYVKCTSASPNTPKTAKNGRSAARHVQLAGPVEQQVRGEQHEREQRARPGELRPGRPACRCA